MSSSQPPIDSIYARQDGIFAAPVDQQHPCGPRDTGERRRRVPASGRRLAILAAVAVAAASGSAAIATGAVTTGAPTAHGSSSVASTRGLAVATRYPSFEHRIRVLEARGYSDVACVIGGERLFNPRTHRYLTVRA